MAYLPEVKNAALRIKTPLVNEITCHYEGLAPPDLGSQFSTKQRDSLIVLCGDCNFIDNK